MGFRFPGQTEFFAERCGVKNFAMCLTGGRLTVALVTTHIPLRKVPQRSSSPRLCASGYCCMDFLPPGQHGATHRRRRTEPARRRIWKLGHEEIEIIAPAMAELNPKAEIDNPFTGPHSPDTVFHRAIEGEFDAVLCMYHDQGLIPLKLHSFHSGVNVTLGLPFPRTSPDHGTAFEIAGKNIARPDS